MLHISLGFSFCILTAVIQAIYLENSFCSEDPMMKIYCCILTNPSLHITYQTVPCYNSHLWATHKNKKMSDCAFVNLSSFAYKLFSSLATEDNVLISPLSISSALALASAGATANSSCLKEFHSILNINSHEDIPALSKHLLDSATKDGIKLTTANGVWTKDLKPSYISTVEKVHYAKADILPQTYGPIDQFVNEKTNGLIKDMLVGDIDPLVVGVLVNAVYFKGSWMEKFDEVKTYEKVFTCANGSSKPAKFMFADRKMQFLEEVDSLDNASIVKLDYGSRNKDDVSMDEEAEFSALFILPEKEGKEGMQRVIKQLDAIHSDNSGESELGAILDDMKQPRKVKLHLPRFKVEYGVKSIKDELKSLGLKTCFDQDNGFLEMSNDPLVHLDDVLHKAVMEVSEEGTEAAAATAAIMMTRSMPIMPIPELIFDRPFLMLVLHTKTMTPLFLSKVDDPEFLF